MQRGGGDENKLSIHLNGGGRNLNIQKGERFVLETGGEVFMELSFVEKRGDIFVFNGFINSDFYDTGIWNFQNWFTLTSDAGRLSLVVEIPEKDKIDLFKDKKEKKYTFKITSTLSN